LLRYNRLHVLLIGLVALGACAGPRLPAPNSIDVRYDSGDHAIQIMVSSLQPPSAANLVSDQGERYPASGIALVSSPHVLYSPPPSIGLGIGDARPAHSAWQRNSLFSM
jgi:hypothetical protein